MPDRALRTTTLLLLPLLPACDGGDDACKDGCSETGESGETGDTNTEETGHTGETGETGETGQVDLCPESTVTFEGLDGSVQDLSDALLTGEYVTLDSPGRLLVCPGTWFARLLLRADVEIEGLGASPEETVLSAGEVGTILDVSGPKVNVGVHNLTLDRGAGLNEEHNSGGGGLYCASFGVVTVSDVIFSNNFANDGAGLYTEDCEVDLSGVRFVDNLSEDDGGALTVWFSTLTMSDATFQDNVGLDGGAMAAFYSDVTISDATFQDNTSSMYAGGLWLYNSTLTMSDTTFSGNQNGGGDGGGLYAYGTTTLERVVFEGNSAVRGGGLFVYYESDVSGTDCDFDGNDPQDIFAADYSEAGGQSYEASAGYSFACAENVCTGG